MRIARVEAIPFHAERDLSPATGTAGSPATLRSGTSHYRWADNYPVLYSTRFETALVRITLDSGLIGWGEAQAPVAPEVACAIVDRILVPVLEGEEFDGTVAAIEALWWRMYSTMRVRGQTGGFMLDAIAGVDLALWDLAGKLTGQPVSVLAGGQANTTVSAYLSGLPGGNPDSVRPYVDAGFRYVKIFHHSGLSQLLTNCDTVLRLLGSTGQVAADALWRLTPESAPELATELASRNALFLEAPLPPESARDHAELAATTSTPLAIGESYRTVFELQPFFDAKAMHIVQPDLGRTGITEGLRIARAAAAHNIQVIPHVSIAMGPQLAAAIHFAAAVNSPLLEFNPNVLTVANRYLRDPLQVEEARYVVPLSPGLGVSLDNWDGLATAAR